MWMVKIIISSQHVLLSHAIHPFIISLVASFAVPARATAVEGEPFIICVQMSSTPAASVLGQEVIVQLSTLAGTGMVLCATLSLEGLILLQQLPVMETFPLLPLL